MVIPQKNGPYPKIVDNMVYGLGPWVMDGPGSGFPVTTYEALHPWASFPKHVLS